MTGSEPAHASRTEPRRGGLEVWAPSVTPPIGIDLTDAATMPPKLDASAWPGVPGRPAWSSTMLSATMSIRETNSARSA